MKTLLRVVGILLALTVMIGAGICGLFGLSLGIPGRDLFGHQRITPIFNMQTLNGALMLLIALGAAWLVYRLVRAMRKRR